MLRPSRTAALLAAAVLLAPAPHLHAAPAPRAFSAGEDVYVAVKCGRLITGTGEEKENVTVLVKNGKVEEIGEKVELPHPCEVIDASRATVMPGHIHPFSRMSLLGYARGGQRADLRVADEFFPDAKDFEDALAAGFTTLQLVGPGSSGIPGRCMVVRTADVGSGWSLRDDGAILANMINTAQDRKLLRDTLTAARQEIEKQDKARADFEAKKKTAQEKNEEQKKKEEEAKKQGQPPQPSPQPSPSEPPKPEPPKPEPPKRDDPPKPAPEGQPEAPKPPNPEEEFKPPPIPPPLQPFVDLLQKKEGARLLVRLAGASTYLHYLEAIKDFEVADALYADVTPRAGRPQAFFGVAGTDLHWVTKRFAEQKDLVVLAPYLSYVQGSIDYVNVPKEYAGAGIKVAFTPRSDAADELDAWRFNVAELVKGGLPRADAIAAITKHAAEAAGVADRVGTLEKGKDANLIVLTGDPFDAQTVVDRVVIEGSVVHTRGQQRTGKGTRS